MPRDRAIARAGPLATPSFSDHPLLKTTLSFLSSRPKRTQISCHAALDTPRVRLSLKERRMMFTRATNIYRKSGVAEERDLQFLFGLT